MKKFSYLFLAFAAIVLASCQEKITPNPEPDEIITGAYVLNNGKWGGNNANVSVFNVEKKKFYKDVFGSVNQKGLGDLGQDILVNGEEVYIAVNGSQVVFVTDRDLRIKKSIVAEADGLVLSPRYLCKGGDKIYVSYYEGYLGEISGNYNVRTTKVGPNPEGVGYADGKIYVANSGGYLPDFDNTVSVVDAASFKEEKKITVNTNPAAVKVCGSKVYVSSLGNYGGILPKVQLIENGKVSDLNYDSPSAIAMSGETLFVLCGGYDENWNPLPGSVYAHDAKDNKPLRKFASGISKAYSIAATRDYLWIGSSDYVTEGDILVLSVADGSYVTKFSSGGLNPICVAE